MRTKERAEADLMAALKGVAIGLVIGLLMYAFDAFPQSIQWRLIGSDPVAANTWSCTYEGRMSDGRTTITTIIHRGFACPTQPGAEF